MDVTSKFDLKSADYDSLCAYMTQLGEKKFRATQIYEWMHVRHVTSIDEMTNLSKKLREQLKEQCTFTVLKPLEVQISKQDGTRKYLFGLDDGNMIESVLMRYKHGNSVCISSQAGCRMGCRFCASTLDGLARSLVLQSAIYNSTREANDMSQDAAAFVRNSRSHSWASRLVMKPVFFFCTLLPVQSVYLNLLYHLPVLGSLATDIFGLLRDAVGYDRFKFP